MTETRYRPRKIIITFNGICPGYFVLKEIYKECLFKVAKPFLESRDNLCGVIALLLSSHARVLVDRQRFIKDKTKPDASKY